jgi:NRPS condensation-like uncharacterized protein
MADKYKVEIFDIWQYFAKPGYEPLIRCRIDFANHIDADILKKAVTLSFNAIPLISCRFDDTSRRPRWIEKKFTGDDIVHLVNAHHDTDEQITGLLASDIDFATEPQLKLYLVRRNDGDTLCAIINHMICDGAGFKEYLYLLSKLYSDCKSRGDAPVPEYNSRGIKPLFADITLAEKIRIMRSSYDAYDSSITTEQAGVAFEEGADSPFMQTRAIAPDDFAKIKNFAAQNGVTVNDMLMTAFARAFCSDTGTDKIKFSCTMDLRKYIPAGEKHGICNLSTNCMCGISVRENDPFASTLKQVFEQMQSHKSNDNILKSVMLWNLAVHLLPYRFLERNYNKVVTYPIISFTNLGIISRESLCFEDSPIKSAYLTASIKAAPHLQMTVSTYGDSCTLGCNIYGADCDKKWVEQLLDGVVTELFNLVSKL